MRWEARWHRNGTLCVLAKEKGYNTYPYLSVYLQDVASFQYKRYNTHQYVMIFNENVMTFTVEKLREANVMILSENVMNHIAQKLRDALKSYESL